MPPISSFGDVIGLFTPSTELIMSRESNGLKMHQNEMFMKIVSDSIKLSISLRRNEKNEENEEILYYLSISIDLYYQYTFFYNISSKS